MAEKAHPSTLLDDLNAALKGGDAGAAASTLSILARARGMTEVSHATGIRRDNLYRMLTSKSDPRLSVFLQVAEALDLEVRIDAKS